MGYMYETGWAKFGWLLVKTAGFVLASFVFSLVFWITKKCVDNATMKTAEKPKKKK